MAPNRKRYKQSDKGRDAIRKQNSEHRQLGFKSLNKPFPGSVGHHIDEEYIIHIPEELHRSIKHSVRTGKGMEAINTIAFRYITEEVFDKLMEEISREVKRKKDIV